MANHATATWVCPQCQRRVPAPVATCRCGAERPAVAPSPIVDGDSAASRPSRVALGRLILVALVALGGMAWLYTGAQPRRPAPARRPASAAPGQPAADRTDERTLAFRASPAETTTTSAPPMPAPAAPSNLTTPAASLEDVIGRVSPAVVTIQTPTGRGSGFFVAADTILTNVHVVTSNASVTVRRADGSTTTARVEGESTAYDIAVLKIANPILDQPIIPMATTAGVRVGQEVIAIGTPLGFLETTVSRGIVSALRDVDGATMIQTDASINPGNSGGPLIDRGGAAIGIVKSGYSGRNGLSFAVAIDHARTVLDGRMSTTAPVRETSAYRALSPAVPSPADQRRADADKTFEQTIAQLGRRADALDERWRSFTANCYEGRIVGNFDRAWFALWEPRSMQGAVAPGCGPTFGDLRQHAFAIRDGVGAADEAARQAGVYPGTRRDVLRRWRLDYGGWNK
jgi:S1-C subfamily serine protease